jgi:hypothetical protein
MSFNSFLTQNLRFMNYSRPLEPKLTWRRERTKTKPSREHDYLKLDENLIARPALLSC